MGMADNGTKRITIKIGGVKLEAELKNNKTTEAIYAALPVEAPVNSWGEEFFFKMPGVKDHREIATTQVKVGDVAFWGGGRSPRHFLRPDADEHGVRSRARRPGQCDRPDRGRCEPVATGLGGDHHPGRQGMSRLMQRLPDGSGIAGNG